MTEEKKLRRFGRYLILDHLVDGGMAKICRARFLGEQADKVVAIKMIQPQFSKDENFKVMFLDEIKVTFGLNHPNIAQTYDYGMIEDQLYTAMEYVDGANLKQFLDRLKEKKFVFPVEISTHIISQVCQGLSYAHNFTDKLSGEKLNIIHRDISPHNIMITFDGAVKVIDFGIAKSSTNSEATQAGTIKGKLSYLAPEYLDGAVLDHKYDQFAVGITLWELLCSRKLFQAPNELATLKLIQNCKVPAPSSINPNVPKELDQIIMKALSKDRKLRYENMDQFNRALVKFLYSNYPDFNASDLGHFGKELFKDDIKKDRAKLYEFGQIDITQYLEDYKNEVATNKSGGSKSSSSSKDDAKKKGYVNFELEDKVNEDSTARIKLEKTNSKTSTQIRELKQRNNEKKRQARNGAVKATGGTRITENKLKNKTRLDIKSSKAEEKKQASKILILAVVAGFLGVYQKDQILSFIKNDLGVNVGTQRVPASVKEKKIGTILVTGLRPTQTLFINDKEESYTALGIEVPLSTDISVRVEEDLRKPFFATVKLTESQDTVSVKVPKLLEVPFGEIYSSSDYPKGTEVHIEIDGHTIKKPLPIRRMRMPAGEYQVKIYNKQLGISKKLPMKVEEEKRAKIPTY